MKTIDQPTEDALQELAHDLEQLAEELRARAWRGREAKTLEGTSRKLSDAARTLGEKLE